MSNNLRYLIYNMPDGDGRVQVVIKDENIWCTQNAMAELFGVGVPAISKHLANIYAENKLEKEATVSKMEIVQTEGTRNIKRLTEFYNLDAIIAVGYRVSSLKATRFRQWATQILNEYIRKGFVLDDDRLKQGDEEAFRRGLHQFLELKRNN